MVSQQRTSTFSSVQHNVGIDGDLEAVGRCGTIDLRTGVTCVAPIYHHGSCQFVSRETIAQVLEHYQAKEA